MCNQVRLSILAVGLLSLGSWAQPVVAAPSVTFGRDDSTTFMTSFPNSLAAFNAFTGALPSYGVETVESLAGFDPTLTFGVTGITATSQGVLAQSAPGFQINNQALLEADAAGFPQASTVFTFNQLITAFGTYVIQVGDGANNNPITFRLRNTVANTSVDVPVQVGPGWGTDNAFFFGVVDSNPFNEVSIIETADLSDGSLYDNIVAGNVPEPSSQVLMMIGGAFALCRGARGRRG